MRFIDERMIYKDGVNEMMEMGGGYDEEMLKWKIKEIGILGMIINVMEIISWIIERRIDMRLG